MHRAPALVLLGLAAATLAGCGLDASLAIGSDGRAAVHVETFIEADLIDGSGPTCTDVMTGVLGDWLSVDEASVAEVPDASGLRCTLDQRVDLTRQGWDGQSGAPLWSGDAAGGYVLDLPFSQGTGSGALSAGDLRAAGFSGDVSLSVRMPAPITSATAGRVEGDTVTLSGLSTLVSDLRVRTGTPASDLRWVTAAAAALAAILVLALGVVLARRRLHPRPGPGGGRDRSSPSSGSPTADEGGADSADRVRRGTPGARRGRGVRTTRWPSDWPGGSGS